MFDSHWCKRCYNDFIMKLVSVIDSEALVEILRDKTNDRLLLDTAVSKSFTVKMAKKRLTLIRLGFLRVVFSGRWVNLHSPPLHISKKTYLIST